MSVGRWGAKKREEVEEPEDEGEAAPADLAKSLWTLVTVIFGSGAGALALGPPTDVPALTTGLCISVAALVWLLARLLGKRLGRRTPERRLGADYLAILVAAGALVLSSVIGYVLAHDRLTASCGGERHIIGTELTGPADAIVRARGYTTAEDLLMSAGCSAKDVWTATSLQQSAVLLWSTFFVLVGALVFPVIFLWHVLAATRSTRAS